MAGDLSARRDRLCYPLPTSQTYTGIFTRKEKSKSGHLRYYLYSESDEIELAAEFHDSGTLYFPIAMGSVNFTDLNNPLYLGEMSREKESNTYIVNLRGNQNEQIKVLSVRYLCRWEKRPLDCSRIMVVRPFENGEPKSEVVQWDFRENIKNVFPKMECDAEKSAKNFYLGGGDGTHQFSFAKVAEDEYHFGVSGGLSIFQGFAIAVSTFHKTRHEN
jgi:hypothetical protein